MAENLISVDDAAAELGVSRATVWNWIRRFELKTFRILGERRTMLLREDVARLREPIPVDQSKKVAA